jgi:hypothetical protein
LPSLLREIFAGATPRATTDKFRFRVLSLKASKALDGVYDSAQRCQNPRRRAERTPKHPLFTNDRPRFSHLRVASASTNMGKEEKRIALFYQTALFQPLMFVVDIFLAIGGKQFHNILSLAFVYSIVGMGAMCVLIWLKLTTQPWLMQPVLGLMLAPVYVILAALAFVATK